MSDATMYLLKHVIRWDLQFNCNSLSVSHCLDPCASGPCQNGGICVNQRNETFTCECPATCECVDMGYFCERGELYLSQSIPEQNVN